MIYTSRSSLKSYKVQYTLSYFMPEKDQSRGALVATMCIWIQNDQLDSQVFCIALPQRYQCIRRD